MSDAIKLGCLLYFNGADEATSFTDDSVNSLSIANNDIARAKLDTATKKFGSASCEMTLGANFSAEDFSHEGVNKYTTTTRIYGANIAIGTEIYNNTRNQYSYVTDVVYDEITAGSPPTTAYKYYIDISPGIAGQDAGDVIYHAGTDVVIPNTGGVVNLNNDFAISMQIKKGACAGTFLDTGAFKLKLQSDETVKVYSLTTEIMESTDVISTSAFTWLLFVRSGSRLALYIDGAKQDECLEAPWSLNTNIQLGNYYGGAGAGFAGWVDEVQIWDGIPLINSQLLTEVDVPTSEYVDDDDVEVVNLSLQTEITADDVEVANLNLDVEVTADDVEIVNLNLDVEVAEFPLLTTNPATNIDSTTVTMNGTFYSGINAITEMGFVYDTSATPTTADTKATISIDSGDLSDNITGLTPAQTYYYRAFATVDITTESDTDAIPTMTSNIAPSGTASASTEFSATYEAWKAFNDDINTYWATTIAGVIPSWLEYEFGSSKIITKYKITARADASDGAPKDWTFEGYNGATWDILDTQTGITFTNGEQKEYSFSNTTGYTRYRINISANGGRTTTNIAVMAMFETTISSTTYYGDDEEFTTSNPIPDGLKFEVLEFVDEYVAEAGTDTTNVYITAHGLTTDDFMVNVTRRSEDAERGSRLVYDTVTPGPNAFTIQTAITGQTAGDTIRTYTYTDRLGIIVPKTFRMTRKTAGRTTASFTIVTTKDFILYPGNYIKLNVYDQTSAEYRQKFKGTIRTANYKLVINKSGESLLYGRITVAGYNEIPSRRTIQIQYDTGDSYGDIVDDMVDNYLFQDGIKKGTIDAGVTLDDDWNNDVISISDILNEAAEKSGYQWFVDDDGELNFYEDPVVIPDCAFSLDTEAASKPFKDIEIDWGLDNYVNKVFICGGYDERGEDIIISGEDFTKSTEMQELHAGTGVFGQVIKDGSILDADYKTAQASTTTTRIYQASHGVAVGDLIYNFTRGVSRIVRSIDTGYFDVDAITGMSGEASDTAEAGTTTTIIKMTGHSLSVGDMIYNETRTTYRIVVSVIDADNITVEAVTSQTSGDTITRSGDIIVYYHKANNMIRNMLKKQSSRPATLTFETSRTDINPGEKMPANIPEMNIDEDFLVEETEVADIGLTRGNAWLKVRAVRRDNSNFTTQKTPKFEDFWGRF